MLLVNGVFLHSYTLKFSAVRICIYTYIMSCVLFRNNKRRHSDNDDSIGNLSESRSTQDKIEYYNGNLLLPIFSTKKNILSPHEVIHLLYDIGKSVSTEQVCTQQPLRVEHHRTFIVDLESLKSQKDIRCDDIGSWRNNSSNKYNFVRNGDDWVQIEKREAKGEMVTLKREYYKLVDDECDLRKRLDTIIRKYGS